MDVFVIRADATDHTGRRAQAILDASLRDERERTRRRVLVGVLAALSAPLFVRAVWPDVLSPLTARLVESLWAMVAALYAVIVLTSRTRSRT